MCSVTEWVHVWECMEWDGGFGAWDEWRVHKSMHI